MGTAADENEWPCCYCHKLECVCDPNDTRVRDEFHRLMPGIAKRIREQGLPLVFTPYETHINDQMEAMGRKAK